MDRFRTTMTSEFEMKNLGLMNYILGMKISQLKDKKIISQGSM